MFFTGLRIGNLLVLKWSDIQEDEMLNVQRRLSKNKIIAGTKTGKDLSYPLPAELLFILLKHKKSLIKQQLVNDYVFPNIQGDHHARSILKLPFLKIAQSSGITKRITPHGARRSMTDYLRGTGIVGKSITGHVTDQMVEHYSTVQPVEQAQAIEKAMEGVILPSIEAKV